LERKIAGLLGAVAALGTFGSAQAATAPTPSAVLQANSYADLLEPIPNAGALLLAIDEQRPVAESRTGEFQVAAHHHHHHHHAFRRAVRVIVPHRRHHHHHHHHH
jgi:hypothetical protein